MHSLSSYLRDVRRAALTSLNRRNVLAANSKPIVSFTFDDFPRSAYTTGGAILERYHVRGTYYVAAGLVDSTNELGEHFHLRDLSDLVKGGHELGCHTQNHLSCRSSTRAAYATDSSVGQLSVCAMTGEDEALNFAYPFGHVTLAAKKDLAHLHRSCRGTIGGINHGSIDLNMLRANKIYGAMGEFPPLQDVITRNQELGGWLIFYTHDVRENPSAYGCTPGLLEAVVRFAVESGAQILTVDQVLQAIGVGRQPIWRSGTSPHPAAVRSVDVVSL